MNAPLARDMLIDPRLSLTGVCKDYYSQSTHQWHRILSNITFSMRQGEKLAILGRNGAGKSTLIRLIAGVELPTRGKISQTMSVSWPVGLGGALSPNLTGNDNIRLISRLYDRPVKEIRDYVDDFSELGKSLSEPVYTYSSGMAARLNFALSLAIDFDCYLIDEIISVGDQRFAKRSHEELFEKRADRTLILASHHAETVRSYCSRALLLYRRNGKLFDDMDLALDIYRDM